MASLGQGEIFSDFGDELNAEDSEATRQSFDSAENETYRSFVGEKKIYHKNYIKYQIVSVILSIISLPCYRIRPSAV